MSESCVASSMKSRRNGPIKLKQRVYLRGLHVNHFGDAALHDEEMRIVHVELNLRETGEKRKREQRPLQKFHFASVVVPNERGFALCPVAPSFR